jgi:hypothetical protein
LRNHKLISGLFLLLFRVFDFSPFMQEWTSKFGLLVSLGTHLPLINEVSILCNGSVLFFMFILFERMKGFMFWFKQLVCNIC